MTAAAWQQNSDPARGFISHRRLLPALAALALLGASDPGQATGLNRVADGPAMQSNSSSPAAPAEQLVQVKSWGYQLQRIDPAVVAASPYDLVVIDYSRDGTPAKAFAPTEVAQMQARPGGGTRLVLAYLSIGEAEHYRFYWRRHWSWMRSPAWSWFWRLFGDRLLPSWLGAANTEWRGNYAVDYAHPGWQAIIAGGPGSYLDRIIQAGFDGVYLDRVDAHDQVADGSQAARAAMIAFVRRIADEARRQRPGFLIVAQNGEELVHDDGYRALLDGLAKEDLLYGESRGRGRNDPGSVAENIADLQLLTAEGKPVFVVEYLRNPELIERARREITGHGFVPYFADRELNHLRMGGLPRPPPKPR